MRCALSNPTLQRTCSSLTLGTRPLNVKGVSHTGLANDEQRKLGVFRLQMRGETADLSTLGRALPSMWQRVFLPWSQDPGPPEEQSRRLENLEEGHAGDDHRVGTPA